MKLVPLKPRIDGIRFAANRQKFLAYSVNVCKDDLNNNIFLSYLLLAKKILLCSLLPPH